MNLKKLLFIFLLAGCGKATQVLLVIPKVKAQQIQVHQLKVLNLSEDATEISTGEDEILFFIHLIEKKGEQTKVTKNVYFRTDFDTTKMTLEIDVNFQFKNSAFICFTLVELDKEASENDVVEIIDDYLLQDNIRENELDSLLGHDDLLGLKKYSIDKLIQNEHFLIDFEGLQVFDRYHYRLWCKLE